MLEGKRVKHIKPYDISNTLGEYGTITNTNSQTASIEFDNGIRYDIPYSALCTEQADLPVQTLDVGDYVRYIGGGRYLNMEWIGAIFYYDGRFKWWDSIRDYECFYEKIELKEGTMFRIGNTKEVYGLPDKVLDHKVHRISTIDGTTITFEYKDEKHTVYTWNIIPIEDEEPRVNDTIYYNNRYLGVTESKDGMLTLKNGVKVLVEKVKLYRRRPKDENFKYKQLVYNTGQFGNSLEHPLQEIFDCKDVYTAYNGKLLYCKNKDGLPCYLTQEDVEIIKLEGEFIFTYTDEQKDLIKQFDPKLSRNYSLEDYSLFMNKETGVEFAVKYKKSDSNFCQNKKTSRRGQLINVPYGKRNRFTINGTMHQASQEALKAFDDWFTDGDFIRHTHEVEDAIVYVYEVKRNKLNEFKQKTKIING